MHDPSHADYFYVPVYGGCFISEVRFTAFSPMILIGTRRSCHIPYHCSHCPLVSSGSSIVLRHATGCATGVTRARKLILRRCAQCVGTRHSCITFRMRIRSGTALVVATIFGRSLTTRAHATRLQLSLELSSLCIGGARTHVRFATAIALRLPAASEPYRGIDTTLPVVVRCAGPNGSSEYHLWRVRPHARRMYGWHRCYDPCKDLVLPSWRNPMSIARSPSMSTFSAGGSGKQAQRKRWLFYFNGNMGIQPTGGGSLVNYSFGLRQQVCGDSVQRLPNLFGVMAIGLG